MNKCFTVGRHFGKSLMNKKLFDMIKQFPTIEMMKQLNDDRLDETSRYIRYRYPEEDKHNYRPKPEGAWNITDNPVGYLARLADEMLP